eukprot:COSAG06_NODE_8204_length_2239_cov_2.454673_3_plen_105_part_00
MRGEIGRPISLEICPSRGSSIMSTFGAICACVSVLAKQAAARGRGALALLRVPPRGLCMARQLWPGASNTSQMRRRATPSEGGWPHCPRRACQIVEIGAAGRQW